MPRTETTILTNMCMIYDGTKVLIQEKVNDRYTGVTFPGGHVEKGEPFTDAVIREVQEETGYLIAEPMLCGIKDWIREDGIRYVVLLYKTNKYGGQLKSSDEGVVSWVEFDEMTHMNLAGGMEEMLQVFIKDEYSEFFFCKKDGKWIEELK